jgi:hypothetical protein
LDFGFLILDLQGCGSKTIIVASEKNPASRLDILPRGRRM